MNNSEFPYQLYLVISEEACAGRDLVQVAEQAVKGGVDIVQLREKKDSFSTFLAKAGKLQEMLSRYNVPLIINDNLQVANVIGAYGIHVGNNDISPMEIRKNWSQCKILGYSIEYMDQLYNEHTYTADYLGISPVFRTPTKTDTVTEWGLHGIRQIREATTKPLVAIGNINADNAFDIINAGADCIAVVSAICKAINPEKAANKIKNQIEKSVKMAQNRY
ncbi:thiamine phosphate synthase [Leeuwenhoekiella sp. A16]|uniref:thiamine phosphate synthase n=1 Tax=Leeuwenhoekiella sp. A16 TaxID=3141462 RepID=UPI003A8098FE